MSSVELTVSPVDLQNTDSEKAHLQQSTDAYAVATTVVPQDPQRQTSLSSAMPSTHLQSQDPVLATWTNQRKLTSTLLMYLMMVIYLE